VVCTRLVSSNLLLVESSSAAAVRELRRQIVVTTLVVFVAFVVRSVHSTMFAVARQLQDVARTCPGVTSLCDPSCYDVFTLMFVWILNTPEFQATVVLVSSPLTLLVALWGMTSRQMLQTMKSSQREMPSALLR
jgi:choline-glycine betaine transporter